MTKSKKNKNKPKLNLTVRDEQRKKLEQMASLENRSLSNLIEVMADEATIWWLEGEGANPNNDFSTLVMGLPNYLDDNNGLYGVGVLNLWADSNHTQFAQDQLMLVPDGGSTVMLLGLGSLGLFVGKWKLNRRSHAA